MHQSVDTLAWFGHWIRYSVICLLRHYPLSITFRSAVSTQAREMSVSMSNLVRQEQPATAQAESLAWRGTPVPHTCHTPNSLLHVMNERIARLAHERNLRLVASPTEYKSFVLLFESFRFLIRVLASQFLEFSQAIFHPPPKPTPKPTSHAPNEPKPVTSPNT